MPKLMPLYMLSAVVIAAAGTSAFAQGAKVAPKQNAKVMTANGSTTAAGNVNNNVVIQSPRTGGDVARNSRDFVGATGGSAVFQPSTTTTTDVRNQENRRQTEGTRSSGSSATTTGSGTGTGTNTSTNTGTGGNTGNTSGNNNTGSSSVNGSGAITNPDNTQTSSGNSDTNTTATNPLLLNGVIAAGIAGSDVVMDEQNATTNAQADATLSANPAALNGTAADNVRANASLDRVINQAARDRRKIGRNGQLLNSIAPRTNVDRSSEMPDDGPTPALKGLISR